jgi:hypothetical protein
MNGNLFTAYYVIAKQIYGNKLANMGGSEDLILWRVYINRNRYYKYNEIEYITTEPVKVITEKQANRLVKRGFRNKKVLIASNVTELSEDFYHTEKYMNEHGEWETYNDMPLQKYDDVGFVELVKQGLEIF